MYIFSGVERDKGNKKTRICGIAIRVFFIYYAIIA